LTVAHQARVPGDSRWYAWGALVLGSSRLPVRAVVVMGGATLWLGTMLVRTGGGGMRALWAHVLVLSVLVAIGSYGRTIAVSKLLRVLLLGGVLMAVMYVLSSVVVTPLVGQRSRPRDFVVPTLEQVLYLVPLIPVVWAQVRRRGQPVGATDLLLLGAAVGVGFGVVEEAYLYTRPNDYLSWLPTVYVGPWRLAASHAVWAALGGATIGLGLLLRRHGAVWVVVAASGSVLAALDHIANNYSKWSDTLATLLNLVTLNGWLVVVLFLGAAALCLAADRLVYSRYASAPSTAEATEPWIKRWEAVRRARAQALVRFDADHATSRTEPGDDDAAEEDEDDQRPH
jgi:RsiW-degrading membrane proteinase PrsW (M82 family)